MFAYQYLHGRRTAPVSKTSVKVITASLISSFALAVSANMSGNGGQYNLQPFSVDLSARLPHMLDLINRTELPSQEEYPGVTPIQGITLERLKTLREEWVTDFEWEKEEAAMNKFNHFTADIENLTVHFIHHKSKSPNAIPLALFHGWPGSFLEFTPLIDSLTQETTTANGTTAAFDVIIPSLPGYAFSSAPPENWTVDDTARVFNTLLTNVLGYDKYAIFGTDWGCGVAWSAYDNFNTSVRATHLSFLPFRPVPKQELKDQGITLSPLEEFEADLSDAWTKTGIGYFTEQTTKPNTIGLALYDNPVGQLAWIGEKYQNWSDPRAGTPPSVLDNKEILRSVSLYYLTKTFISSGYIYSQNPNGFKTEYIKARNDAPLLFSCFKYNSGFWPPALVAKVGNMVNYTNHEFGGHFPGLDNPPALLEDLRQIADYWRA